MYAEEITIKNCYIIDQLCPNAINNMHSLPLEFCSTNGELAKGTEMNHSTAKFCVQFINHLSNKIQLQSFNGGNIIITFQISSSYKRSLPLIAVSYQLLILFSYQLLILFNKISLTSSYLLVTQS